MKFSNIFVSIVLFVLGAFFYGNQHYLILDEDNSSRVLENIHKAIEEDKLEEYWRFNVYELHEMWTDQDVGFAIKENNELIYWSSEELPQTILENTKNSKRLKYRINKNTINSYQVFYIKLLNKEKDSQLITTISMLFMIIGVYIFARFFIKYYHIRKKNIGLLVATLCVFIGLIFIFHFVSSIGDLFKPRVQISVFRIPLFLSIFYTISFALVVFYCIKNIKLPNKQRTYTTLIKAFILLSLNYTLVYVAYEIINNTSLDMNPANFSRFSFEDRGLLTNVLICYFIVGFTARYYLLSLRDEVRTFVRFICFLLIGRVIYLIIFPPEWNVINEFFLPLIILVFYFRSSFWTKGLRLVLFSIITVLITSINIQLTEEKKESSNKKEFAQSIINKEGEDWENLYNRLNYFFSNSAYIKNLVEDPGSYQKWQLEQFINSKDKLLEDFDIDIQVFMYDKKGEPLYVVSRKQENFNSLINHPNTKQLFGDFYELVSERNNFSYLATIELEESDVYIVIKRSQLKISQGFEKLFEENTNSTNYDEEEFSFAIYNKGSLIQEKGNFNYREFSSRFNLQEIGELFFNYDGYNHYLLKPSNKNFNVVVSKKIKEWYAPLSTFSHVMLFYIILSLVLFVIYTPKLYFNISTLKNKLMFVTIFGVTISLIILGVVSYTKTTQVLHNQNKVKIKEQLYMLYSEIIKDTEVVPVNQNDFLDFLNYRIKNISQYIVSEVALYDRNGKMLLSTIEPLYERGYLLPYMDDIAKAEILYDKKQYIILSKNLEDIEYIDGYLPIFNMLGEIRAFIGIKYVVNPIAENQNLYSILRSSVNIIVVLIIFTVLLALFVGDLITRPLEILNRAIKQVKFGQSNKPIVYTNNDEFRDLIDVYNQKVIDLESAAHKIVEQERESTWRDVAKQVAHEIKNPLTPIKLNIQYLQKTFNPEDSVWVNKFNNFVLNVEEQVDALTQIANSFSEYAKMPKFQFEEFNLIEVLQNEQNLFSSENTEIEIHFNQPRLIICGDKAKLNRVFNNLIKNAIQAKKEKEDAKIDIYVYEFDQNVVIEFIDYGVGIDADTLKNIFLPKFTTKSTGMGLGLSMVKNIIEEHGGKITVHSEIGVKTNFNIQLPKSQL